MDPVIEPVITANSKFSIDLLKELCKETTGDVIFSPLSVSSALGLVLLGAGGNTSKEMFQTLHFGKMKIMYHFLYEELYKEGEVKNQHERSLQLANRLFGDKTINFNDDFLDLCEDWCFGSLRSVDFKTDPETARNKINAWVQKICELKDFLDEGDVTKDTCLALISAVHFNRKWATGFKHFVQKDKEILWPMMGKTEKLPLGTIPHRQYQLPVEAQILEIPYEYNHLSMLIILPAKSADLSQDLENLSQLVNSITYEKLMEWTEPDNMIPTEVKILLPIFTLQEKYDLQTALEALGTHDLFTDECDLSGMTEDGKLKLSKLVHKAVVDVNEAGTDAAAGGGGAVSKLLCSNGDPPADFTADHPFLFFIRHNSTKSILFWGRVTSPIPII